jgi:hypothetical protein
MKIADLELLREPDLIWSWRYVIIAVTIRLAWKMSGKRYSREKRG